MTDNSTATLGYVNDGIQISLGPAAAAGDLYVFTEWDPTSASDWDALRAA